jgi:hypothetical protein
LIAISAWNCRRRKPVSFRAADWIVCFTDSVNSVNIVSSLSDAAQMKCATGAQMKCHTG